MHFKGDSGGGLFKTDRIGGQQKPVLAGLVSYGANLCDDATQPEYMIFHFSHSDIIIIISLFSLFHSFIITKRVYTRVSYYLNWIEEKLNFIYFKK